MGSIVPKPIKEMVLKQWLLGDTREDIAFSNDISTGSVSNIIGQARRIILDIDEMRQIALMVKKNDILLNEIPPAVRLKKKLDKFGLGEEDLEQFIEETNILCFQKGMDPKEFICIVLKVYKEFITLDLPIEKMLLFFEQAKEELSRLDREIKQKREEKKKLTESYDLSAKELIKYQQENKELREKISGFRQEIISKDNAIKEQSIIISHQEAENLILNARIISLESQLESVNEYLNPQEPIDMQ